MNLSPIIRPGINEGEKILHALQHSLHFPQSKPHLSIHTNDTEKDPI